MFSKSWCPFSTKSKQLFKKLNLDFKVYEIDKENDGSLVHKILKEMTNWHIDWFESQRAVPQKAVPIIFINGKHIGGNDELQKANKSGELNKLLDTGK